MMEINRRNFIGLLSATSFITLFGQEEVSAQIKNFKIASPVNQFTYTYVGGPIECFMRSTIKQAFPRIARVDYYANGNFIGSGVRNPAAFRNFYFAWQVPIPSIQGDNYSLRADAIRYRTGDIVATDTVSFRIVRLMG